jgi:hypothetical protein
VNQWLNPLKTWTGSNLVDVGREATHDVRLSDTDSNPVSTRWVGGREESLRRTHGDVAGEELVAHPVNRYIVNVGTIPKQPSSPTSQVGDGKVRCRPTVSEWGGGSVVVRGRESRPHGEGTQRVSNNSVAMAGERW